MSELILLEGDCLSIMPELPDSSVDMVLVDLPYGTTRNKWDSQLPLGSLWSEYLRLARADAVFVFTATQPFSSAVVMSQPKLFKYDWTWRKPKGTNHLNAKKQPMRDKEDILVFARGRAPYNPQMTKGDPYQARGGRRNDDTYGEYTNERNNNPGLRYPKQVLEFPIVERNKLHPSQKPVELLSYMIRTYTQPGATVLDNAMGSGSTGEAALQEGRKFIGIEKDQAFFRTAQKRLELMELLG